MSRCSLLKASAIIGLVAGLAACDASSSVLSPRSGANAAAAGRVLTPADTSGKRSGTTMQSLDGDTTCRAGYQIAYRDDGSWYCEPINGGGD